MLFNGHAFCQIPRLVDIAAAQHPYVVCKKLERHHKKHRGEIRMNVRHNDAVP
jgi:hypothetical protein